MLKLKKKFFHTLFVSLFLFQSLVHGSQANALIVAACTHDPIARENLCCAGICCLFLLFPVGVALDKESINEDFDKKLGFLSQTAEGDELKDLIAKKAKRKKSSKVTKIDDNRVGVRLSESKVRAALDKGDYRESEIKKAVKVLCHDMDEG